MKPGFHYSDVKPEPNSHCAVAYRHSSYRFGKMPIIERSHLQLGYPSTSIYQASGIVWID